MLIHNTLTASAISTQFDTPPLHLEMLHAGLSSHSFISSLLLIKGWGCNGQAPQSIQTNSARFLFLKKPHFKLHIVLFAVCILKINSCVEY